MTASPSAKKVAKGESKGKGKKVQRTFWITRPTAEKLSRLVDARGGRCTGQVGEEAIALLYQSDPLMKHQPPIHDDPTGREKKDGVDAMLDQFDALRTRK